MAWPASLQPVRVILVRHVREVWRRLATFVRSDASTHPIRVTDGEQPTGSHAARQNHTAALLAACCERGVPYQPPPEGRIVAGIAQVLGAGGQQRLH